MTGNKFLKQICKKSENFNMSTSYKCLTLKFWGWLVFFLKITKHHGCGKFSESPGKEYIKNDDPGVNFKIVKNLISVSTHKFWGWLGFFKNSRNTMGEVYFRKALGKSTAKMMISGVKFKIVKNLVSQLSKFVVGWVFQKVKEARRAAH